MKRLAIQIRQCMSTFETSSPSSKKARKENVDDDFEAYLASKAMAGLGTEKRTKIDIDSALIKLESSPSSQAPNLIKEPLDIVKALPTTQASVERLIVFGAEVVVNRQTYAIGGRHSERYPFS